MEGWAGFPSSQFGTGDDLLCTAGDRSNGVAACYGLLAASPDTPTNQKEKSSLSFMLASLGKRNKTAHLILSLTDFLGNGLLVSLM